MTDVYRFNRGTVGSLEFAGPVLRVWNDLTKPLEILDPTIRAMNASARPLISNYVEASMYAAAHSSAWWNHPTTYHPHMIWMDSKLDGRPLVNAIKRLTTFTKLPDDWDSYGSVAPSKLSMSIALALLLDLWQEGVISTAIKVDLVPVPTGGVQLEWSGINGDIEIEIDRSGIITYLIDWNGGTYEASPEDQSLSLLEIGDQVRRVVF